MGELTREELAARLESVDTRMVARARATDSKIEALEAKMDSKIDALENRIDARFAQFEARMQKSFTDLIKWMVGTAIAMMAVGVTFLIFLFGNFTPGHPAPIVITVPSTSVPAAPR